jgi:hypothetical protein
LIERLEDDEKKGKRRCLVQPVLQIVRATSTLPVRWIRKLDPIKLLKQARA